MVSLGAHATTGYFALGYGAKSMGLAGAVVSNPQDSLAAAANPAGMALVGDRRVDLGVRMFSPIREAELDPRVVGGSFKVDDKSTDKIFVIPNMGFTQKVTDRLWLGFSAYGNGGLNTTYGRNIYDETSAVLGAARVGGPAAAAAVPQGTTTGTEDTGTLGVDLKQIIFAPTAAFKFTDTLTVGVAPLIAWQEFKAYGLGNFQCFTPTGNSDGGVSCQTTGQPAQKSTHLTDRGGEGSYGFGVRAGVVWDAHPMVTLGLSGATQIDMDRFHKYQELFAERGDLDIPANVAAGVTLHATPAIDIMFDWQHIFYKGPRSISNKGPVPSAAGPTLPAGSGLLGQDNGLGFGWQDVNIYRVAADWRINSEWGIRGGVAYNTNPINDSQILFNVLAPATIQWHTTLGVTWHPKDYVEFSAAYMHAWENDNKTDQTAFGVPGKIQMYQNSLDVSVGVKF